MYDLGPRQFEELMAEIFERQGPKVQLTQQTRDGGVDLRVIHQTRAGRLLTLVDTKRYARHRPVGVGVVRQLHGAVEAQSASAGLIATTSFYTRDARNREQQIPFRIGLKDYLEVARWWKRSHGQSGRQARAVSWSPRGPK
jgi:restriction system protein